MGSYESSERKADDNSGDENRSSDAQDHVAESGAALAAVVGVFAIGVLMSFLGSDNAGRKTMKAPGRNYRIFRDDFEKDPASYFRNLRKLAYRKGLDQPDLKKTYNNGN